jgi:ABC-type uncharacterized transport system substrate-binding protein
MPELRPAFAFRPASLARFLGLAAAIACLMPLAIRPALAHPHIWVTARTTVLYENGSIVGLRHSWTFDEYYTAMAIDGLDTNKDGIYSREELAELAKVNVEALKEFGYFTYPKLKGPDRKVDPASAAKPPAEPVLPRTGADKIADAASKPAKELTLYFTLPLAKPVLAEAEGFTFSLADPSFFIAFEPAATNPVTLGAGAPKNCHVTNLAEIKQPDANPSKPGDLMASRPSDLSVNIVSGPSWQVTCAAGG